MVVRSGSGSEMGSPDEFEAMAQACIANHEVVMRHGSPEARTASRMLLYALADEVWRRAEGEVASAYDNELRYLTDDTGNRA